MTESVEWERLADHEEGKPTAVSTGSPAERVKAWRDAWMANVKDNHVIMAWIGRASARYAPDDCPELTIADVDGLLAELEAANKRAETAERELAELRAEAADPFNPQRIAEAVKRARRQRDEAVEAIAAERDEYVEELARLRQQLQPATVLPERWRELMAERDAARRELAEVRERVAAQVTDHLRRRAHDAAIADVNGYSCEAAATWMAAAQLVESGEWKVADDA